MNDLAAAVERVWPGRGARFEVLGGGITNHNVKVTRPDGVYVLRVAGRDTDLLGIETWHPKHSKPYADLRGTILAAAKAYADDVASGTFPGPEQTVRMADDVLDEVLGRGAPDQGAEMISGGIPLDRDL